MTKLEIKLAEQLMDIIDKLCREAFDYNNNKSYVYHQHSTYYENALYLLENLGLATYIEHGKYKGTYRLEQNKLK